MPGNEGGGRGAPLLEQEGLFDAGGFVRLRNAVGAYLRARRADLAPKSRAEYASILYGASNAIGPDLVISRLSRRHIEQWLAGLEVSPATRRHRLSTVRGFCQWCVITDEVPLKRDPSLGIRGPRQPQAMPRELDQESVAKILRSAPDTRGQLVVLLGVHEGLRVAEVAGLLRENIDIDGGLLLVHGKNSKERWLPISPETAAAIRAYIVQCPGPNGPLLRSETHPSRGIGAQYLGKLAVRYFYAAGIKVGPYDGRSHHAFRHTAAGQILDQGGDVRDVRDALGHSDLNTASIYLRKRVAQSKLRAVMGQRTYLD